MLKIKINLRQIMKNKNITQSQLSDKTGVRQAAISDLLNMKYQSINIKHVESIINVLGIKDIENIIEIVEEV